jgi:hypothetical protein
VAQVTRRNRKWTPTFYQRHVLLCLAQRGESTTSDWGTWYPMNVDQVPGVIRRLAERGMVDVAGFDGQARTYKLTQAGLETANSLSSEEES